MNMLADFFTTFLATLFIIICVLLILVVLLQKGRGGGLSAAFSGMGSTAFGTRVGDVLTWVTVVMTGLFLVLATAVTLRFKPVNEAVAAPAFVPAEMPISGPTPVVIKGVTGAKFWYTLDGSDPKKEASGSKLYERAVSVEPGQTLKARAYIEGLTESAVTTAKYPLAKPEEPVVPTSAPAPTAASMPAAGLVPSSMPATPVVVPSTQPAL